MGCAKLSVTIPQSLYADAKETSSRRHIKLSHLVTEALTDKLKQIKQERYLQQINAVYKDPEIAAQHREMAEAIASNTDIEELPW